MTVVKSLILFALAAIAEIGGGGVIALGSLLGGVVMDGFRPDRYDLVGAAICLVGVAIIMYARSAA